MTHAVADRVQETSTTTGTGTLDLAGAVTGFQTFVAGIGDGKTCDYCITFGTDWEVGRGTVTDAATDTLSRTTIHASSNAGAAVNWGAGTKTVFCTKPAVAAPKINIQAITATGAQTYTPTVGMNWCIAILTGGGGGGGGASASPGCGSGGGSGGTAIEFYSAATIGASQTVTIGDGGAGSTTGTGTTGTDSTFGALMTGSGGVGGLLGGITATVNGGAGGAASGGIMNIPGGYGGQNATGAAAATSSSGDGGASFWGGGVSGRAVNAPPVTPINSTVYGSGGHGAATNGVPDGTGGKGAPGVCLIIEFA